MSDDADIPHPRQTLSLYGHAEAEHSFLDAYRAGRMPHAWLIGGPRGVGKATLAYRMARFVFAHPVPPATPKVAQNASAIARNTAQNAPGVAQNAAGLALPADHGVVRRVAAQGHPDLLALERVADDKGKVPMFIPVDMVRKTIGFFGSTAGEGGWRVCIVDSADELNAAGANALLKILEEPPSKCLLLVVSHAPGRLLPTIRSRCRRLALRALSAEDVARAVADALARDAADAEIKAAAAASDGSVSRALDLLAGTALQVRERVNAMLAALPAVNPRDLHALGDALGRDETAFTAFVDAVRDWLSARISVAGAEPRRRADMAEVWEKLNTTVRDVLDYNLERKPLVFNVFDWLAAATRG